VEPDATRAMKTHEMTKGRDLSQCVYPSPCFLSYFVTAPTDDGLEAHSMFLFILCLPVVRWCKDLSFFR
jgi:hypothetical protein